MMNLNYATGLQGVNHAMPKTQKSTNIAFGALDYEKNLEKIRPVLKEFDLPGGIETIDEIIGQKFPIKYHDRDKTSGGLQEGTVKFRKDHCYPIVDIYDKNGEIITYTRFRVVKEENDSGDYDNMKRLYDKVDKGCIRAEYQDFVHGESRYDYNYSTIATALTTEVLEKLAKQMDLDGVYISPVHKRTPTLAKLGFEQVNLDIKKVNTALDVYGKAEQVFDSNQGGMFKAVG